jgi:hypothetical protein
VSQVRAGKAGASSCRVCNVIETMGALAVDRGVEGRPAGMTDMRGRHMRTQTPGVDPAGVGPAGADPATAEMRRRMGGEMPVAAHTHGAAAEMDTAAAHTHGTAAKVSSATATAEMGATAATAAAEVSATAAAAKMSTTTTTTAETAASRVSSRRQTKGYGYCGRACRDFPHDTPRQGQMRQTNARSPGPFRRDAALHTCALGHP